MNIKTFSVMSICFALIAPLFGCGRAPEEKVLARVDDEPVITVAKFNERISKLPPRYQEIISRNKGQFLDELVVDHLLYQEAISRGFEKDEEVREVIEEARRKILIARLLKDEVEDEITVTDEEVVDYYEANKEKFSVPEVLRASHILVKTQEEAEDVLSELAAGKEFEELARNRSVDPTAKTGGDIGYFTRNQLVPDFEEACFALKPGEISGVVKTKFGYHIIKLTEKKEPRVKELDEVTADIREIIKRLKKKMLFSDYVSRLKEKSKITVNKELLASISEEGASRRAEENSPDEPEQ